MKEADMQHVGEWILRVLKAANEESAITAVRNEVREFARQFPVPGIS
jgi:glycine hydroxymethyltransferase